MTFRSIKQTIALVLLLIVFPAGSWYYLKSGFSYRKSALGELKDYGNAKDFVLLDFQNNEIPLDSTHVYLVQIRKNAGVDSNLNNILKAYESRNDVVAMQILCDDSMPKDSTEMKRIKQIQVNKQLCTLIGNIDTKIQSDGVKSPNILLVNNKGKVVQGYDITENNERARLIKHVSITMPGVKKVEKVLKVTDKEK